MTTPQSVVEALWSRVRAHTGDILDAITVKAQEVAADAQEVRDIRDSSAVPNDAVDLPQLAPGVRSTLEGLPTALAGKADLVNGEVPTSQIPAVALTKPMSVTSRAAMLALTAQEGDVAIITTGEEKGSYMLGDGPPGVFESWVELATAPDIPVHSVNGQTGTIVLGPEDVEAAPASHTHTREQVTGLDTALAGKADLVNGEVPTSQIPAVALTKPQSVASRAAMLSLTDVQEGDVVIITTGDDKGSYMLGDGPANAFESWHTLVVSQDAPVTSVNGQVGAIVLGPGDVGAAPKSHSHPADKIDNLDALIDQRAMDLLREVPMLMMWDGQGEWVSPEWASTKQGVLNMATQEIHSVEEING